jgi:hypothetical protein
MRLTHRARTMWGVENSHLAPTAPHDDSGGRYVIRLRGELDPSWSEWLGGLEIAWDQHGNTLLCGVIVDQSALHGILTRIRDLGLPLLGIEQLD